MMNLQQAADWLQALVEARNDAEPRAPTHALRPGDFL
jgi:hypothetical protein